MIEIHLLILNERDNLSLPDLTDTALIDKIKATKAEKTYRERVAAYSLLSLLCEEKGCKMPTIVCNDLGKPAFFTSAQEVDKKRSGPFFFNISHSENLVAIIKSEEERELGIDAQIMPSEEKLSRIAERFLKCGTEKLHTGYDGEIKILYYIIKEGKISRADIEEIDKPFDIREAPFYREAPLTEWTLLEASLKALGGGFSEYPRIKDLPEGKIKTKSFEILLGVDKYALSIAISY